MNTLLSLLFFIFNRILSTTSRPRDLKFDCIENTDKIICRFANPNLKKPDHYNTVVRYDINEHSKAKIAEKIVTDVNLIGEVLSYLNHHQNGWTQLFLTTKPANNVGLFFYSQDCELDFVGIGSNFFVRQAFGKTWFRKVTDEELKDIFDILRLKR